MLVRFRVGKPSAVTFDIGVFQMRPPSICPPPMLSLVQEQVVIITGLRAGTASDRYACAVGRTMPTEE